MYIVAQEFSIEQKSTKIKNLASVVLIFLSLVFIMYLSIYVRSSTLDSPTVLDYDPWWWYRYTEHILDNNMKFPKWDELSHYPPGRPINPLPGWSYTMAVLYKILKPLLGMTLTDAAKWSTLIFAAATVVPAFLLGRMLAGNIAGIATALFGVLSLALIGVSMAGYCDTDMPVVFYTFLTVYAILLAIRRKFNINSIPYYLFAIVSMLLFAFNWPYGWIVLIFFTIFLPVLFVFRIVEQIVHNRQLRFDLKEVNVEIKKLLVPIIIIIVITNVLGHFLNLKNMIRQFFTGIRFYQGKALLVNISVAELQILNIFTRSGFEAIVGRVGLGPVLFTLALPFLAFYKIYKKEKIKDIEIFLYLWAFITFILITRGVRFSLLFSTATAVAAGYTIGNIPKYLKSRFFKSTFYAFTTLLMIMFISDAIAIGYTGRGMQISNNWYDMLDWLKENADPESLVVTWWDPGHIIAGYTGLHVHADGAHCPVDVCIPYNHDDRIQDMGRIFSISDEDEAFSIVKKYKQLTPEQCQEARKAFGDIVPADVCDEIVEMYVIASNDLIGKYYWMSYFGTGTGRNYFQMQMTNYDANQGVIEYNRGTVNLIYDNGQWVAALNLPEQGIRNVRVSHIVYFENGQEKHLNFTGRPNIIDGMVWVDPSFTVAIFMDGAIRDSIFTKMFFFDGEGLQHFDLVYQNPEIRLFKVIW